MPAQISSRILAFHFPCAFCEIKAGASRPPAQPPGSITHYPRYRPEIQKSWASGRQHRTVAEEPRNYPSAAANPRGCHEQPHLRVIEIIGTSPDGIDWETRNRLAQAAATTREFHWFVLQSVRGYRENRAIARRRRRPLIQAYTVSRNQDDMPSQGDHRATFSPKRARHKAAGLLATSSDDAHAPGHHRDPNHCEDGYQELPTVSPRLVARQSQCRLGFRRRAVVVSRCSTGRCGLFGRSYRSGAGSSSSAPMTNRCTGSPFSSLKGSGAGR